MESDALASPQEVAAAGTPILQDVGSAALALPQEVAAAGTPILQDVGSAALVLPREIIAAGTLSPQYVESAELALPREVVPMRRGIAAQSISQSARSVGAVCRGQGPVDVGVARGHSRRRHPYTTVRGGFSVGVVETRIFAAS